MPRKSSKARREELAAADPVMADLIERIGPLDLATRLRRRKEERPPDAYGALLRSIVGQQVSTKAARAIYLRVLDLFDGHTPTPAPAPGGERGGTARGRASRGARSNTSATSPSTSRKASWSSTGSRRCADEDAIAEITAVRGLGRWTAEIFLLFHLGRPDVISGGDLGIRKAIMIEDGLGEMPTPTEVEERSEALAAEPHPRDALSVGVAARDPRLIAPFAYLICAAIIHPRRMSAPALPKIGTCVFVFGSDWSPRWSSGPAPSSARSSSTTTTNSEFHTRQQRRGGRGRRARRSRWERSRSASSPPRPPSSRPTDTSPSTSSRSSRQSLVEGRTSSTRPPSSTSSTPTERAEYEREQGFPIIEKRRRREGRQSEPASVYYPLTYRASKHEKFAAQALGFDVATDPERAPYLKRAAEDGKATATAGDHAADRRHTGSTSSAPSTATGRRPRPPPSAAAR